VQLAKRRPAMAVVVGNAASVEIMTSSSITTSWLMLIRDPPPITTLFLIVKTGRFRNRPVAM
jgi:hypothetical protein